MVRVLLVRHGTTESNLRDARMAVSIARGDLKMFGKGDVPVDRETAPDAMKALMAELEPDEQCGDTNLSTHKGGGREQAQLLADYWAPILLGKARAAELHVYTSPMQRCMQTVDPLMRVFGADCGLTASIQPKLCEVPGLCHPDDRQFLEAQVFARFRAGDLDGGRAVLARRDFQRCGLTKAEISAQYGWAAEFGDTSDGRFPEHEPWYPGCWESHGATVARIEDCKDWLLGLAKQLPENDVVMCISHGDTIWKLFGALVGIDSTKVAHGTMNTSLTSIKIEANGEVMIDFYNRTPHLLDADGDK